MKESKYGKDWDVYFMNIARVVGRHSKCRSRQIGSVLVKDKRIIATGYNGPPVGVSPCETRISHIEERFNVVKIDDEVFDVVWKPEFENMCPRKVINAKSGERLDLCIAAHSEANAVQQVGRDGAIGSTLYCFCGPPCVTCTTTIINCGVETIVCLDFPFYDKGSKDLLEKSDVKLIKYNLEEIEKIGSERYGVEQRKQENIY